MPPSAEVVIRLALADEPPRIHALVQAIADETFAYLVPLPVPLGAPNWQFAWVAVSAEDILGVTMTQEDWVSDLWVARDHRRQGIGSLLLAQAEREIGSRGHRVFRIRVVKSNTRAVDFYRSHGWSVHHEFPHQKFGHTMFEMNKPNAELEEPPQK
jgi:ribosomal protein S18 acetylase RimI-like enzyme